MTGKQVAFLAALMVAAAGPRVSAQSDADAFSDFYACDAINAPAERLACFDAVMKKQKLIRGIRDGSAESAAENRTNYKALRSGPVNRAPLNPVRGEANGATGSNRGSAGASSSRGAAARSGQLDFDDLTVPYETRVVAYNANAVGDFKLRIAEGLVFESTSGAEMREDPTDKTVTLRKNLFGQWRLKIPGETALIPVAPVRN